MKTNFKILDKSYKTINYINKVLIDYPKKEVVLKNNIEQTCYELIKNSYSYNINDSIRIKDKNLKDLLISISMLNFHINISHDKKVISEKKYIVIGNFLSEIIAMTKALRKKEATINE